MKYTYKQSPTCSLKSNQANPSLQFLFVSFFRPGHMPRHMPDKGPPQLLAVIPTPPCSCPSTHFIYLFFTSPFLPHLFQCLPLFFSSFSYLNYCLLLLSIVFKCLNRPQEGSRGRPEAQGPRHVPFVPLWGSLWSMGTHLCSNKVISIFLILFFR